MDAKPDQDDDDMSPAGAVRRYLSLIVDTPVSDTRLGDAFDLLGDMYRAVDSQPAESFFALAAYLDSADRHRRITAAAILVVLVHEDTLVPYGPELNTAETIVIDCLRGSKPEEQLRALAVLAQHTFPEVFIGPLTCLLTRRGYDLSICASLALRRCAPEQIVAASAAEMLGAARTASRSDPLEDMQEALRLGMQQEVPQILRSNCAAAILETEEPDSPAYDTAIAVLKAIDTPFAFGPLMGIYKSGRASAILLALLEKRVRDRDQPVQLRIAMAGALGSVARDLPETIGKVIRITQHERHEMLLSMLAGLQQRPITNTEVIELLVPLLRSLDRVVQLHTMWTLSMAQPVPAKALPWVVELIEQNDDTDLLAAAAQVLLAAGPAALPILRTFVESGRPRLTGVVGTVVHGMQVEHVRAVLTAYEAQYEWIADSVLRAAFTKLGAATEPLVPYLCQQLDTTYEGLKKETYLHCIARSRVKDAATVKAVARHLADRSDQTWQLAEAVLLDMGAAALAPLAEMRESAPPHEKARLETVINHIAALQQPSAQQAHQTGESMEVDADYLRRCQDLGDDQLLRLFVLVVNVMKKSEGSASFGDVAAELLRMREGKKISNELAIQKPALLGKMKALSLALGGVMLFTRREGRQGGLTPEAEKLWAAARVHLRSRAGTS